MAGILRPLNQDKSFEPAVVGIGFQKCGSTSLHNLLGLAGVSFFEKELQLAMKPGLSRERYLGAFPRAPEAEIVGEFTPNYIYSVPAMRFLARELTDTKFLVVMRNPIDRFYSAANHARGQGHIAKDLSAQEILDGAISGNRHHWPRGVVTNGLYGEHLERALSLVPISRIHFCFLEDIMNERNGRDTRASILSFCGLNREYADLELPHVNQAKDQLKGVPKLQRSSSVDQRLKDIYGPSTGLLESILGRKAPWSF